MPNRHDPDAAGRGSEKVRPHSVPSGLGDLPWELPHTFLGLDEPADSFERADAILLPVPYESTTSWGGGTRRGPAGILSASRYVELYDQEFDCEPGARLSIHTLPAIELTRAGATPAMQELQEVYGRVADAAGDRFVLMLGGEHSVSSPAILAQAERHSDRISVLQMDAHADLRGEYEGTANSHASAMARVLDRADVVGVGLRAVSQEEVDVSRASTASTLIWADEMWENDAWMDRALEALGPKVYLTFDVDYFDSSLVPSTGTPEPGGGDWYRTLRFLKRVFAEREVIAADIVELAPVPGLNAPDFLVAKLAYKLISYRFQARLT
ncbi:MAG: agmatinase [Gemmatimonadetes bacterium]|nr:agmatinase [Gemmatimonadota bacterium]MDA1103008.1 agmatinase [Gemmatimonadota bacterium]